MRNHYSKYEITKGSCPPASCRQEKDFSFHFVYSKRSFLLRANRSENGRDREMKKKSTRCVPFFPSRHEASRGKTYDKMSTEKKARMEKP